MPSASTSAAESTSEGDIPANARSFARRLRVANKSPNTIKAYLDAVTRLDGILAVRGMPQAVTAIHREHVEAFSEVAGLTVEDIDWDHGVAIVTGKGRRPRTVAFGRKVAQAVDRYARARGQHPDAGAPWRWLGRKGRLTSTALAQMLKTAGATSRYPRDPPAPVPPHVRPSVARRWRLRRRSDAAGRLR